MTTQTHIIIKTHNKHAYIPEPESSLEEEEEESAEKTEEMSFPAPVAIIRVGDNISLEIQVGFSGAGLVSLGRS